VLTSTIGYIQTTLVLLSIAMVTLVTEFIWIQVVYRNFPILAMDTSNKDSSSTTRTSGGGVANWLKREKQDWAEFSRLPIFFSQSLKMLMLMLTWLTYRLYCYCSDLSHDTVLWSVFWSCRGHNLTSRWDFHSISQVCQEERRLFHSSHAGESPISSHNAALIP
jgi:hypothetical protein